MTMTDDLEDAGEETLSTAEVARRLRDSGALESCSPQIYRGQLPLTGDGGLVPELIKAALERGLQAELPDHLGYDEGDPDIAMFPNSRNGYTLKTVLSKWARLI